MLGLKSALAFAIVIAIVGALATAIGGSWDLFALFVALVALQTVLAYAMLGRRRVVTLRADLARWLEERSATTGEGLSRVVDRSVATYRDGLTPSDE